MAFPETCCTVLLLVTASSWAKWTGQEGSVEAGATRSHRLKQQRLGLTPWTVNELLKAPVRIREPVASKVTSKNSIPKSVLMGGKCQDNQVPEQVP